MIHRDIKPANLFLCRMGEEYDFLKVLDFGLVKSLEFTEEQEQLQALADSSGLSFSQESEETNRAKKVPLKNSFAMEDVETQKTLKDSKNTNSNPLTIAGTVMGTPAYMAPEQMLAQPLDGRTDLYALACVAYWLLASRMVFEGKDPVSLAFAHISEEPVPLANVCLQPIPEELAQLIHQCLAKDPKERPESAAAVLEQVELMEKTYPWTNAEAKNWWMTHSPKRRQASSVDSLAVTIQPTERMEMSPPKVEN